MQNGKPFSGQTNLNLRLFLEIMDTVSSRTKRRGAICYSLQKLASLIVRGCISAYGTGNLHIWKAPSMLKGIYRFRATYAPIQITPFTGKTLRIRGIQY